jgi:hypothetical protein
MVTREHLDDVALFVIHICDDSVEAARDLDCRFVALNFA